MKEANIIADVQLGIQAQIIGDAWLRENREFNAVTVMYPVLELLEWVENVSLWDRFISWISHSVCRRVFI